MLPVGKLFAQISVIKAVGSLSAVFVVLSGVQLSLCHNFLQNYFFIISMETNHVQTIHLL